MMKQISRLLFAAPLYVMLALLFFFGSCQSSDNARAGEGASVASLPLTAQIGEVSSRMVMSDTYGGTFSCYWNSDKFNVYHPYVLNGAVQSMEPLEFATSANGGVSAKFAYTGKDAYRYNPGARIFAFSEGTSGNYTTSVTNDGRSTLTANALASQKGTLNDCATYDALYGSTGVDYSTGLPETLAMHHLFGMMNLHLTSSTFSTGYPVTVTLTSSAANILPGNSGSATLGTDGSLGVLTGSWGTSWSATVTPTAAGVVDVYFMTWPFTGSTGTLTVSCSDGTGNIYTSRKINLSGFSLAAAQLKSKPLAITSTPFVFDSSKLYAWDATDNQPITLNRRPNNANTSITASDYLNHASYACKNCPNYCEISWYLSVPCYWDDGIVNTTSYKLIDGTTTKNGMWFRKSSGITGYSSTTPSSMTGATATKLSSLSAAAITALNLSVNYFFLPEVGSTDSHSGTFPSGDGSYYWSSTPSSSSSTTYALTISTNGASLGRCSRTYGGCLWQAQ